MELHPDYRREGMCADEIRQRPNCSNEFLSQKREKSASHRKPMMNPQTEKLCSTLGIDDPLHVAMIAAGATH